MRWSCSAGPAWPWPRTPETSRDRRHHPGHRGRAVRRGVRVLAGRADRPAARAGGHSPHRAGRDLLRRSSVAQELATSGLLDPATSLLLAGAVYGTRAGGDRPRDLAESDLTRALQAAFSQPDFRASLSGKEGADELLAEVEEAAYQVFVARKFYNDLVAVTRDARNRPLARVLHLSGHAEAPVFFEMDDSLIADKPGAWIGPAGHTMV